jgi:hypothetical protein
MTSNEPVILHSADLCQHLRNQIYLENHEGIEDLLSTIEGLLYLVLDDPDTLVTLRRGTEDAA